MIISCYTVSTVYIAFEFWLAKWPVQIVCTSILWNWLAILITLCAICAKGYAFGACMCVTKTNNCLHTHWSSIFAKRCIPLTYMSPEMFARSIESYKECYSQQFCSCDFLPPGFMGALSKCYGKQSTDNARQCAWEYVLCGTRVYTMDGLKKCSYNILHWVYIAHMFTWCEYVELISVPSPIIIIFIACCWMWCWV